jgi:hypothetical protein
MIRENPASGAPEVGRVIARKSLADATEYYDREIEAMQEGKRAAYGLYRAVDPRASSEANICEE